MASQREIKVFAGKDAPPGVVTDYIVVGRFPPSGRRQAMLAVKRACEQAGIPVPIEVDQYFLGLSNPEDIDLSFVCRQKVFEEYGGTGLIIDAAKIPQGLQEILIVCPVE